MSDKVKFIQTTSAKLSTVAQKAGQIILCTDTGKIYQDTIGGSCRIWSNYFTSK